MTAPALRVLEANARFYRRTWRGSVISTFAVPFFTLLAMGGGLGRLVDQGAGTGRGPYLGFVAPALLAATAMMTAAGEATYPVVAGIKWTKGYHAAIATPIRPADLVYGLIGFLGVRLLFNLGVYAGIMILLGAMEPGPALLAVIPSVLTGIAFAAPIAAWTCQLEDDRALSSFFRFAIIPLFLFSGTFFPVDQLPGFLQPFIFISPLWHGIELARGVAGVPESPHFSWWIHTLVLIALAAIGLILASKNFTKRLHT